MATNPTAGDGQLREDLRARVKEWTWRTNKKQSALAAECGVAEADLSHFLTGKRGLPDFALANLGVALGIDPARLLVHRVSSQCDHEIAELRTGTASESSAARTRGWERARAAYELLLGGLDRIEPPSTRRGNLGTLVDWPAAFLPLVVFVGDRRESPPQTPADLLAASASLGDLFYFPRLKLPELTEIRSDKTCVLGSAESLRALLKDKNLLVIGSPAANLVAREINSGACFSFPVTPEALEQAEVFKTKLAPIRYLPGELERFAGINSVTTEQIEWSRRRRHMIYGFARSGILDPVHYEGPRGTFTPAHADYGVVTLCRHPWSEDRVAIMAAGLHAPGTAAAVKLLAQGGAFTDRPLGGVFRVHVPIDAPWEERFHHLNPEWDTHKYSVSDYAAAVDEFTAKRQTELKGPMKFWDPTQVRSLIELVSSRLNHEQEDRPGS